MVGLVMHVCNPSTWDYLTALQPVCRQQIPYARKRTRQGSESQVFWAHSCTDPIIYPRGQLHLLQLITYSGSASLGYVVRPVARK